MLSAANSPTNHLPSSGSSSSSSSSSPNSQAGADSPVNQLASRSSHHHQHHHHHHHHHQSQQQQQQQQRTLMDMPHNHAARYSASTAGNTNSLGVGLVPRNHLPPTAVAGAVASQSGASNSANQSAASQLLGAAPPPQAQSGMSLAGDARPRSLAAAMAVLTEERVPCGSGALLVNGPPPNPGASGLEGHETMLVDDTPSGHHLAITASLRSDSPAGDDVASSASFPLSPSLASFADVVPYNWQAGKATIKERISYMFNSPIMADVVFIVGKQRRRIPAHRFVLAVSSAVFDAMFNGPLAANINCASSPAAGGLMPPPVPPQPAPSHSVERRPDEEERRARARGGREEEEDEEEEMEATVSAQSGGRESERSRGDVPEVTVPDVEPSAFLALLKFIYSDEVHISPETVMTTLYTAKKYAVPALEKACVDFLKKNLTSDNAFLLLTQARLFDEGQLASLCLEMIDKNTSDALAADGFAEIDIDTLCAVLDRDTLGIREHKLFTAVVRWGEAECRRRGWPATPENLRKALSRALHLLRFPLMTIDEFANVVVQTEILSDKEMVQLFRYFLVNPKPSIPFIDVARCCLTGKEQVVSRFCAVEQRWGYSGTTDRIRFMVNRKIFVIGFGLYGSIHGAAEYNVRIEINHTDTGRPMGVNETTFQCDGSNSTFRVVFKEPVEISPNVNYMACATLKGPDSFYGTKGLRKITHESVSSGKVTFQFTYAAGNNNGTSVEDGQIPEIIFYL